MRRRSRNTARRFSASSRACRLVSCAARDTSNIYTSRLPDQSEPAHLQPQSRQRGDRKSTRQRLRDEYQSRLNQAYADVAHLRADERDSHATVAADRSRAARRRPRRAARGRGLRAAQPRARRLHRCRKSAALTKRVDVATLRESLAEQRVGLQALLGSAIPDAFSSASDLHRNPCEITYFRRGGRASPLMRFPLPASRS